jgi:hypothetical protein
MMFIATMPKTTPVRFGVQGANPYTEQEIVLGGPLTIAKDAPVTLAFKQD